MSWGALPFWMYQVDFEQHEMKMLGAMNWNNCNEARSGSSRSLPDYNHSFLFGLESEEKKRKKFLERLKK